MSAIDAIIHPFQFKSTSTQSYSGVKTIRLGGREVTFFDTKQNKSVTRSIGGVLVAVSHRIRTGKTAKDKANGHIAYKKNRRVWDNVDRVWVKQ